MRLAYKVKSEFRARLQRYQISFYGLLFEFLIWLDNLLIFEHGLRQGAQDVSSVARFSDRRFFIGDAGNRVVFSDSGLNRING